jgi:O-antigen/teichoic acid export membrane protein
MNSIRKILNSSIIIYIERLLCAISGLILSTVIVKFVSENYYGEVKSFLAYSELLKVIYSLGLGAMLIRFFPIINSITETKKIIKKVVFLTSIFSLVFSCILYFSGKSTLELLLLAFFYMAKSIWFEPFLISMNKRNVVAIIRSMSYLMQMSIICILISLDISENITLAYVVIMFIEFNVLLLYFFSIGNCVNNYSPQLPNIDIKKMAKYAGGSYISSIVMLTSSASIKVVLISIYSSAEMVAMFALAAVFPNLIRSFSPAKILLGYLFPRMLKRIAGNNLSDFTKLRLSLLYSYNNYFLVISSCFLILLSPYIYSFLYNKQLNSDFVLLISILCCSNLTLQFLDLHEALAAIKTKSGIFIYISLFSIVSLLCYPIAIKYFGVLGLVSATWLSTTLILFIYFKLLSNDSMLKFSLLKLFIGCSYILLFTFLYIYQYYSLLYLTLIIIILTSLPFKMFKMELIKNVFK